MHIATKGDQRVGKCGAGLTLLTRGKQARMSLQVQVLEAAFSQFGAVQRAIVVADPANNTSRRSIPAADT